MSEEISIQAKYDSVISRNLKKALKQMSINEDGKIQWKFDFTIEIRKEIIRSKLKTKDTFDNEALRGLIFDSILSLKRNGIENPSPKEFLSELEIKINAYKTKPKKEYTILFPLNTSGGAMLKKRWFNIKKKMFYKSKWEKIHAISGWKDFINHAKSFKYMASNLKDQVIPMYQYFTPFLVDVNARDDREAFQIANKDFELMRAILNLFFKWGQVTFQAGPAQPLGSILPPIFYGIFEKNGNYVSLSFNEEPYVYKIVTLRKENLDKFIQMIKRIEKMDEDIKSVFIDSLLKYVHALDTIDWRDCFLALWQILENLSLCVFSEKMSMKEMCSRIKNLMGYKDLLHKELVEALVDTRNSLVHLGKFSSEGLQEVNYLKIIVDRALSNFYVLSDKFHTKEAFDEFFQIVTLSDSVLKLRKKTAESVIKLHQN